MPNLPLHQIPYLRSHHERARSAKTAANTTDTEVKAALVLVDAITLRGIPAVGRGVAGHIAGTQPETATCQ